MRRALAVAGATLVAVVSMAATASAASTTVLFDGFSPHNFTKAPDADDAFGRLESSKQKCVVGRKVAVYHIDTGPDTKMGTDTSDSNGGWSLMIFHGDFESGDYYAKAPKRVLHDGTVCNGDKSDVTAPF